MVGFLWTASTHDGNCKSTHPLSPERVSDCRDNDTTSSFLIAGQSTHWHLLTHCSHSRAPCHPLRVNCTSFSSARVTQRITVSAVHMSLPAHHSTLQHLPFRCLPSLLFSCKMEEQQNVRQPHGTTWWNHYYYTGIPLSALHPLQQ